MVSRSRALRRQAGTPAPLPRRQAETPTRLDTKRQADVPVGQASPPAAKRSPSTIGTDCAGYNDSVARRPVEQMLDFIAYRDYGTAESAMNPAPIELFTTRELIDELMSRRTLSRRRHSLGKGVERRVARGRYVSGPLQLQPRRRGRQPPARSGGPVHGHPLRQRLIPDRHRHGEDVVDDVVPPVGVAAHRLRPALGVGGTGHQDVPAG